MRLFTILCLLALAGCGPKRTTSNTDNRQAPQPVPNKPVGSEEMAVLTDSLKSLNRIYLGLLATQKTTSDSLVGEIRTKLSGCKVEGRVELNLQLSAEIVTSKPRETPPQEVSTQTYKITKSDTCPFYVEISDVRTRATDLSYFSMTPTRRNFFIFDSALAAKIGAQALSFSTSKKSASLLVNSTDRRLTSSYKFQVTLLNNAKIDVSVGDDILEKINTRGEKSVSGFESVNLKFSDFNALLKREFLGKTEKATLNGEEIDPALYQALTSNISPYLRGQISEF